MNQSATLSALANTASPENRELQSDALLERLRWRYATKKNGPHQGGTAKQGGSNP